MMMMMMRSPGITAELSLSLGDAHLQAQLHHNITTSMHVSRTNTRGERSHMSKTIPSLHLTDSRNNPRCHSSPKFIEFNEFQFQNSAVSTHGHSQIVLTTYIFVAHTSHPHKKGWGGIYTRKTCLVTQPVGTTPKI